MLKAILEGIHRSRVDNPLMYTLYSPFHLSGRLASLASNPSINVAILETLS